MWPILKCCITILNYITRDLHSSQYNHIVTNNDYRMCTRLANYVLIIWVAFILTDFSLQPIMISMEGYPVETHTVVTEDCYILEMHRIPYGKKSPNAKGEEPRPVVYLQHGLLCSSADWVMGSPEKSLGIVKSPFAIVILS